VTGVDVDVDVDVEVVVGGWDVVVVADMGVEGEPQAGMVTRSATAPTTIPAAAQG